MRYRGRRGARIVHMRRTTLTRALLGTLAALALVFSTAGACGGGEDQGPQQQQQQEDGGGEDGEGGEDGGDDG